MKKSTQTGFTLIELIMTIALLAILSTVAVSSFSTLIKNNRITTNTNDFMSALVLARSESLKRRSRTTVCRSVNGTACATSGGWEQGWIIFTDTDNDATVDTGETVLQVYSALDANSRLRGETSVAAYVSYIPTGITQLVGGTTQAGTLILCDDRGFGGRARAIIISATGRPRSAVATDSSAVSCNP
jgi:type IV fimbrial biogenesis protein FimT